MKLFCVRIEGGFSHPEYAAFANRMNDRNGKHPDLGAGMNGALVSHHTDEDTVKLLITEDMKAADAVRVEEVTRDTLKSQHIGYKDLIKNYFLPYNKYPNLQRRSPAPKLKRTI